MRLCLHPFLAAVLAGLLSACGDGGASARGTALSCPRSPAPDGDVGVALEPAFPELAFDFPTAMRQAPGDDRHWYLLERTGVIYRFENRPGASSRTTVLDLSGQIDTGGEGGLLGMAFHPRFQRNGEVFLSFTRDGSPLRSYVSRFRSPDGGRTLDVNSEEPLLTLDQPYANHNGGHIAFGPDGHLYIGFGDGGSAGDPLGNGQDPDTLFGALLRIDADAGDPYGTPADNPFADGGGRAEIYAWGLRNPWRFSFDRQTGGLWLGDVGQNEWEEVDCIDRGGNYGWNIREGAHCYGAPDCDTAGLTDPVAEYGHDLGCSITGGYVYRGSAIPALRGGYIHGDFCSGRIWALFDDGSGEPVVRELLDSDQRIVAFAQGAGGELYVLAADGVFRLAAP